MSQTGLLEQRPATGTRKATLVWLIALGAVVLAVLGLYFAANSGTPPALVAGDFSILLAAMLAGRSCAAAARRGGVNARAWTLMSVAAYVWAAGMLVWTYYGLANNHVYPFPSLADALFLAYSVPAAAALFSFRRPGGTTRVGLARTVLDAAVIAGAVLVISWYTALGPAFSAEGDLLTRLATMGYPVVDVVITSLVLVLGMRRQPGERLPWLCFGGGLLVLTVTDSTYVRLTFDGVTGVTGSPLALGWIGAFLLIALAPLLPYAENPRPDRKAFALALELLPYAPILAGRHDGRPAARQRDERFPADGGQDHCGPHPGPPGPDHHRKPHPHHRAGAGGGCPDGGAGGTGRDRQLLLGRHPEHHAGGRHHQLEPGRGDSSTATRLRRRWAATRGSCCRRTARTATTRWSSNSSKAARP